MKTRFCSFVVLLTNLLILTACTTQSAMQQVKSKYIGSNLDRFILDHGVPKEERQLNNGGYVYIWKSGIITHNVPEKTVTWFGSGGKESGKLIFGSDNFMELYCELQIHTGPGGQILSIKLIKDTQNPNGMSRCADIFSEKRGFFSL